MKLLPLVIIVCMGPFVAFAQHVLHERLGPSVDTLERTYFNLFPGVAGFVSATSSVRASGDVDIVVQRSTIGATSDTTISVDSTTAAALAKYIDGHDVSRRSRRSAKRRVRWDELHGLADYGVIIDSKPGYEGPTEITTTLGTQLQGRMLYVTDTSVVFWSSESWSDWRHAQTPPTVVPFRDMQSLRVDTRGGLWPWVGYGALGGCLGALALMFIPSPMHGDGDFATTRAILMTGFVLNGAILGALMGLMLGLDVNLDADELNSSDPNRALRDALPELRENALYPAYPPPEISRLLNP